VEVAVATAGEDTVITLSPLVFFFVLEEFDCVGGFDATTAWTERTATAGLVLILPGTVEQKRVDRK